MRTVLIWNEQTDYAREVREWTREFERLHGEGVIESLDPETIEGEMFVTAHDILQYPAVVVLTDEGRVLESWKGTPMPQLEEVEYWLSKGE